MDTPNDRPRPDPGPPIRSPECALKIHPAPPPPAPTDEDRAFYLGFTLALAEEDGAPDADAPPSVRAAFEAGHEWGESRRWADPDEAPEWMAEGGAE